MELIIGFFAFIIGLFVGFQYAANMAGKALGTMLNEFGITDQQIVRKAEEMGIDVSRYVEEEETEADTVELVVELQGGIYYAYRWETDEFVAQAETPEQLYAELIELLPANTLVNIDRDRGGEYFKHIAEKG